MSDLAKLNSEMVGAFIRPKRPHRVVGDEYKEIEYLSPEELSGEDVVMQSKKLPAGYEGPCYVVFLDDMLSFSKLGEFNPKGNGTHHYIVVRCNDAEQAKVIAKNGSKDYMRVLGMCVNEPEFSDNVSYSVKDADECPAWLDEAKKRRKKTVYLTEGDLYNIALKVAKRIISETHRR